MTLSAFSKTACRVACSLACAAALLTLSACGGSKNFYAGADARADRAAAGLEADAPAPNATLESQATYIKLVQQMQRDGLWFASLAHLDALELRWSVVPETIRLRADALRHTGQIDESRRQYELLLGTPMAAAALHGLGLIAGNEGNYPLAVELLEKSRQQNPTDGLLLSDVGYANMRAGWLAQARVPVMQAAQLLPADPQVRANLALYLLASRQDAQAEALMTSAAFDPATRAAIRRSALALRALPAKRAAAPVAIAAPAEAVELAGESVAPVALAEPDGPQAGPAARRTASAPRRVHIQVRNAKVDPVAPDDTGAATVTADQVTSSRSDESPP